MPRRRKVNIRPDLVGELFLKTGEDIPYRLISCDSEPRAIMQRVDMKGENDPSYLSHLEDFVQLKPVRPIEQPKKPRADSGGTHKKVARKQTQKEIPTHEEAATLEDEPEIADRKGENLYIHVPTGMEGDTDYIVDIAGSEARGPVGLRVTVLAALEEFDGKIPDELTDQERATIQGILDAGE